MVRSRHHASLAHRRVLCWIIALALTGGLATGCGKKKGETPGNTGKNATGQTSGVNQKGGTIRLDGELFTALKEGSEQCQITGAGARPRDCDEQDKKINALITKKGPAALGTLAIQLTADRRVMRHLAAWYILAHVPSRMRYQIEREPHTVPEGVAEELLRALGQYDTSEEGGHLYASTAIHIATLKGKHDEAVAVTEQLKGARVKANATRALMQYGRLKTFPAVQKLAKSADPKPADPKKMATRGLVRKAAYRAPLAMMKWSDEERAALCPWLDTALKDADADVAAAAARAMLLCGGKHLDHLIDQAEALAKQKKYTSSFNFQVREICAKTRRADNTKPTEAQCKRVRAFFEGLITNNDQPARTRAAALTSIAFAWRTPETLAFIKKFETHPVPEVASASRRHQKMLTAQLRREGKLPK